MPVLEVTDETFEKEVLHSTKPVLVFFWAPGCPPCNALAPILEKIAADVTHVTFVKVNAVQQRGTVAKHNVQAVPTLVLVSRTIGFKSEDEIRRMLAGI